MKPFKFGFGFGSRGSSGFAFTNAKAETFWNSLIAEDPAIYDQYGKTEIAFKQKLNEVFTIIDDAGALDKIKKWCPKIGNTLALHAINSVNPGTHTSAFPNSATFNIDYTGYDGINQYEATGFNENDFTANNNLSISFKVVGQAFQNGDYQISIGNFVYCMVDNVAGGSYKCYLADSVQATSIPFGDGLGFFTFSSIGVNSNSWKDGVKFSDFNNNNRQALVANEIEFMLGAGIYAEADMLHLIFAEGFTDEQCEAVNTAIQTLDTFLGR